MLHPHEDNRYHLSTLLGSVSERHSRYFTKSLSHLTLLTDKRLSCLIHSWLCANHSTLTLNHSPRNSVSSAFTNFAAITHSLSTVELSDYPVLCHLYIGHLRICHLHTCVCVHSCIYMCVYCNNTQCKR